MMWQVPALLTVPYRQSVLVDNCFFPYFYLFSADFQLIIFLFMMLRLCAVPGLWEAVVSESGQIAKKYDNHKFAIALLLAVIDELERIYKEMMKNADTAV